MQSTSKKQNNHFPILILIGRPACGKSEIIDYLQHIDINKRVARFHIKNIQVLDDFPMLWTWFEEDDILEDKFHKERLYTDSLGYFKHDYLWDLLIQRLELEYQKKLKDNPWYDEGNTTIIEFSRGSQHGGYAQALTNFSEDLLNKASILYVNVSYRESQRKNRLRFNPQRPYSILEHALPDEKLEKLYSSDDWHKLTASDKHFLVTGSCRTPYAVFENEDDITTGDSSALGSRLEQALNHLWDIHQMRSSSFSDNKPVKEG